MYNNEILQELVQEHHENDMRDGGYNGLGIDSAHTKDHINKTLLFFIDRLICDGMLDSNDLLILIADINKRTIEAERNFVHSV